MKMEVKDQQRYYQEMDKLNQQQPADQTTSSKTLKKDRKFSKQHEK